MRSVCQSSRPVPSVQALFLILALTSLFLLSACGAPSTQQQAQPAEKAEASSPAESVTTQQSTASVGDKKVGTAVPDRVVKHAGGETKVPGVPQRVVALDFQELEHALALGVTPVGAVTHRQDGVVYDRFKDDMKGVRNVGTPSQPNLEAIAALKPDLILGNAIRHKEVYDKLSQIAPTVLMAEIGEAWKENLQLHAQALGKQAEAEKLMSEYNGRIREFRAAMGDRRETTTVSLLRSLATQTRIYMKDNFVGGVLQDAGLRRPPAQDREGREVATEERIGDFDATYIFISHVFSGDKTGDSHVLQLMKHPLWSQLDAVKQGRVYEVPDEYWFLSGGLLSADLVLDDLFKYLIQ